MKYAKGYNELHKPFCHHLLPGTFDYNTVAHGFPLKKSFVKNATIMIVVMTMIWVFMLLAGIVAETSGLIK